MKKKLFETIVEQKYGIYEQDTIDNAIGIFNGKNISYDDVAKIKSYMEEMEADESYDYLLSHIRPVHVLTPEKLKIVR